MRTLKIITIAIGMLVSVLAVLAILLRALFYAPLGEVPLPPALRAASESELGANMSNEANPLYPKTLRIPKISVNAQIQHVGLTKLGNMAAPNNYRDVGWFKYGTVPGERGNAVIAGHVDNGLALPGVFSELKNIEVGDLIYVETLSGETLRFKVTTLDTYSYDGEASEVFIGGVEQNLILITCTGSWLKDERTHDQRLVVTAQRI